jgi:hypothetical protein
MAGPATIHVILSEAKNLLLIDIIEILRPALRASE